MRSFATVQHLQEHVRVEHPNQTLFTCNERACGEFFLSEAHLRTHRRRHEASLSGALMATAGDGDGHGDRNTSNATAEAAQSPLSKRVAHQERRMRGGSDDDDDDNDGDGDGDAASKGDAVGSDAAAGAVMRVPDASVDPEHLDGKASNAAATAPARLQLPLWRLCSEFVLSLERLGVQVDLDHVLALVDPQRNAGVQRAHGAGRRGRTKWTQTPQAFLPAAHQLPASDRCGDAAELGIGSSASTYTELAPLDPAPTASMQYDSLHGPSLAVRPAGSIARSDSGGHRVHDGTAVVGAPRSAGPLGRPAV